MSCGRSPRFRAMTGTEPKTTLREFREYFASSYEALVHRPMNRGKKDRDPQATARRNDELNASGPAYPLMHVMSDARSHELA
jgi:hypothetical protein